MCGTAPGPGGDRPAAADAQRERRWQRILDCVALRQPDRMPVALYTTFWLARYGGISCRELMYDYEKTAAIAERAVLEFEPDAVAPLFIGNALGPTLEAFGYKQLRWAGHGVGDDQPYQYIDAEYMTAAEYPELLKDPTGFYLRKYLPRIFGAAAGLEKFPPLPGMFYFRAMTGLRPLVDKDLRAALRRLLDAADEVDRVMARSAAWNQRIAALGYPLINGSSSGAPYDVVADYFRGATGMMKDLYRHRDLLLQVVDMMRENLVRMTIANARASGNPIVFIPIHWAPDAFMSPKHFATFWWPSFRQMMLELIDAGLVPMPLWESDCTQRLELIGDIPAGKCIYWFERTDLVRAHAVLGDVVALRGNLSPSLMATGTAEQVDAAVRHLVEKVWNRGGKLILDTAFGIPDETPVENVRAMFGAARRYAG